MLPGGFVEELIFRGFLFPFVFYKSGSLWVCIPVHGLVDVFSRFAAPGGSSDFVYMAATIVVSIADCRYLSRKPAALQPADAET